jgi:hypothetical protein
MAFNDIDVDDDDDDDDDDDNGPHTMVSQWCHNGVTMVLQWCPTHQGRVWFIALLAHFANAL